LPFALYLKTKTKTKLMKNESKKITMATVKKFIRENSGKLYINVKSSFDGMIDGLTYQNDGFAMAETDTLHTDATLGIKGAWFVGSSRDWLTKYEDEKFTGITICNSCGSFILAVRKPLKLSGMMPMGTHTEVN
jgi:hypothetical protein